MANILAYLVEVEDRRLHLQLAYSTMSEFCQRASRMFFAKPAVASHRTSRAR